jgi:hypothetical protein
MISSNFKLSTFEDLKGVSLGSFRSLNLIASRGRHREGKVLTGAISKAAKVPEVDDPIISSYLCPTHRTSGLTHAEISAFQQ